MNDAPTKRGMAARIGICLLDLLQPGLGLIRLAQYRVGITLLIVSLLLLAGFAAIFRTTSQLTYTSFMGLIAVIMLLLLITFAISIILSWRWSAKVESRQGHLWRWYGLIGLWMLLELVLLPITDISHNNYHPYSAASASMAPSLEAGDRFMAMTRPGQTIQRGDVVIVRHGAEEWVKRVAAIPGDTIALTNGIVVLNGVPVKTQLLSKVPRPHDGLAPMASLISEQFPGEARPHSILNNGPARQDNTAPVKLGADQYFLLGDNRDDSADSRITPDDGGLGIVTRQRITGRALFRYWRSGLGLGEGQV